MWDAFLLSAHIVALLSTEMTQLLNAPLRMEAEGFPDRQEIGTVAVSGLREEWEHCTAGCQQAQGNCLFSKHDTGSKVKVKGSQACLFIISFNCSLSLYSSTVFITFSFKRYINFLMFRINKFRIRKKTFCFMSVLSNISWEIVQSFKQMKRYTKCPYQ